jgi:hypothetical protein
MATEYFIVIVNGHTLHRLHAQSRLASSITSSVALSDNMYVATAGNAPGQRGNAEASMTLKRSTPRTLSLVSKTAKGFESGPTELVLVGWCPKT